LEAALLKKGVNPDHPMATIATIQNAKRQVKPIPPIEARVQRAITRIAETDCPVLILGEHGAGKRSIAMQIHAQSNLSRSPFSEIRCCDTDAQALAAALSASGTVYLVEITELSLPLQEFIINTYSRSEPAPACRLLCGSSRELLEEVKSWRMREDFYYIISGVTLRIPPLRCRKSEILSIADELLTQYSKQFDRPKPVLCKEIIEHLMEHSWPDNLSELQTAIKTFVAIGDQAISLAAIKAASPSGRSNSNRRHLLLKEATRASSIQIERQLISEVLASTGGNRKRAAVDLGISYKALLYKLKQIETENQSAPCRNGVAL
jgi:DNA-binding NtrC family response regulator